MRILKISLILRCNSSEYFSNQICGMKHLAPPPNYDHIKFPERTKLIMMERVPTYPVGIKQPKMQKRLRYMRGAELVHNFLLYEQYGIMALGGGRLKWIHFEMIRMTMLRGMDHERMFAIWRVDPPWQPVTKKGQGQRMGGGKSSIDHYVTPVKAGRIILELGGKCEFAEVQNLLGRLAERLPLKAKAVSHQLLKEEKEKEEEAERNNINPYTMKYVIQNNLGGCHKWISPFDLKWFCKHL